MAIKTEVLQNGHIKTYSDAGFYIHGGSPERDYRVAIDPADAERTYVETNRKIPVRPASVADYQEALTRLGVDINGTD